MPRRELRAVSTGKALGAVIANPDGTFTFDQAAQDVFKGMRRRMPDAKLGPLLLADGWSNGYLYLAPEQP